MGQYYRPTILCAKRNTPKVSWNPWDYKNGAKLMEHSYVGNSLCLSVEFYLFQNPCRLVWAGDYADEERDGRTIFEKALNKGKDIQPLFKGDTLHSLLSMWIEQCDVYVINHTKKLYYKQPKEQEEVWVINPLPLLTCEGNSRGGGDYEGTDMELVGSWSRDLISIDAKIPEDFTEIFPGFVES